MIVIARCCFRERGREGDDRERDRERRVGGKKKQNAINGEKKSTSFFLPLFFISQRAYSDLFFVLFFEAESLSALSLSKKEKSGKENIPGSVGPACPKFCFRNFFFGVTGFFLPQACSLSVDPPLPPSPPRLLSSLATLFRLGTKKEKEKASEKAGRQEDGGKSEGRRNGVEKDFCICNLLKKKPGKKTELTSFFSFLFFFLAPKKRRRHFPIFAFYKKKSATRRGRRRGEGGEQVKLGTGGEEKPAKKRGGREKKKKEKKIGGTRKGGRRRRKATRFFCVFFPYRRPSFSGMERESSRFFSCCCFYEKDR